MRDMEIFSDPPEAAVKILLTEADLPSSDVTDEHLKHFFGCGPKERLSGVVGLEIYGTVALLRSLAVAGDCRGYGHGKALVAKAETYARSRRVTEIYLLTTTAERFFERLGYTRISREAAPEAIRRTREFTDLCPSSSSFMMKAMLALPLLQATQNQDRSMKPAILIRKAEVADLAAITEIYNEAILTTTATFDTQPKSTADQLKWFQSHDERHPILVAVIDGKIEGWASLSKWSDRRAYDDTVESSFYVKSEFRGRGIGRMLKGAIIEEARRLHFHTLIARVAEGNPESLHLNESAGFVHVGTLKEVGWKFGKLLDVHILQKILE
jgi:phosphinothricin acetyltransferase